MNACVEKKINHNMAKRGRKPKERKGYFYESEEDAIVKYINEDDIVNKNKIFNEVIYPALTKMIESIIRRYKLFIPDEDFDQNFNDTISYLLTKIANFKPVITGYEEIFDISNIKGQIVQMNEEELKSKMRNATTDDPEYVMVFLGEDKDTLETKYVFFKKETRKYKAYSYCGTVCKNYLMYKSTQYQKKKQRNLSYDNMIEDLIDNSKYSFEEKAPSNLAEKLVIQITHEINNMILEPEKNLLNINEVKVGKALVSLLSDWEHLITNGEGSNKLQKSSVLYFLREETMMTTKEIRDNMKKFKNAYKLIKKANLE